MNFTEHQKPKLGAPMAPPPIQEEPLSPTNSKKLVDDLIRMDSENDFHKPGAELRILR